MEKNDGGPAFPTEPEAHAWAGTDYTGRQVNFEGVCQHKGMSLRQYAAIKLRVPDSGLDWLDEMIREALRDEFAKAAAAGYRASGNTSTEEGISTWAFSGADAMLAEREKGRKG